MIMNSALGSRAVAQKVPIRFLVGVCVSIRDDDGGDGDGDGDDDDSAFSSLLACLHEVTQEVPAQSHTLT